MFKQQKILITTAVLANLLLVTATMPLAAQNGSGNNPMSDSNSNQSNTNQGTDSNSNSGMGSGQSYGLGTIDNPCVLAPVNTSNDQSNGGQNQGMNDSGNYNQDNNNQNNGNTANTNNQRNSGQSQGMSNNNDQNNSQSVNQGLCADYQFGSTRQDARWPVPGYVQIEPKQIQWYRFRYNPQIDTTDSDTGNDQPAETTIQMRTSVPGCANFDVQTRERMNVQQSLSDSDLDPSLRGPVGRGSPAFRNTDDQGNVKENSSDLIWVGRSGAADNYYVIVRNNSTNSCSYLLTIKGTGVSF